MGTIGNGAALWKSLVMLRYYGRKLPGRESRDHKFAVSSLTDEGFSNLKRVLEWS